MVWPWVFSGGSLMSAVSDHLFVDFSAFWQSALLKHVFGFLFVIGATCALLITCPPSGTWVMHVFFHWPFFFKGASMSTSSWLLCRPVHGPFWRVVFCRR